MPKIKIPITKARFWKSGTNENVHRLSGITQNWQFPGDSKWSNCWSKTAVLEQCKLWIKSKTEYLSWSLEMSTWSDNLSILSPPPAMNEQTTILHTKQSTFGNVLVIVYQRRNQVICFNDWGNEKLRMSSESCRKLWS